MQYRVLPGSSEKISVLGFGCMRLPMKDGYREKVFVATKLPCGNIHDRESMEQIFRMELDRLRTDYVDFYLLHSMNGETWERTLFLGIIAFMDSLRAGR